MKLFRITMNDGEIIHFATTSTEAAKDEWEAEFDADDYQLMEEVPESEWESFHITFREDNETDGEEWTETAAFIMNGLTRPQIICTSNPDW